MIKDVSKGTAWVLGSIVGVCVLLIVCAFAFGWTKRFTADYRGETERIEDTTGNGKFRQSVYDSFYDTCSAVQAKEGAITVLKDERETATESRKARIDTSITAIKAIRLDLVSSYNAAASQEVRSAFKASNLPDRLDINNFATECAV